MPSNILRTDPQFPHVSDKNFGDVHEILKRPQFIERIAFTTGTFATGQLLTRDFYNQHFKLSERFHGALGVRFTTVFRMVAAVSPKVGGLLRAFYNPVGVAPFDTISTFKDPNWANFDFCAYSQLPGVELNFEDATAVDLRIPYTHYLDFMPLQGSGFDAEAEPVCLGSFNVLDYLPIRAAPEHGNPSLTIYAWLEDVEIIGARNRVLYSENFIVSQAGGLEEDVEKDGPLSGPLYKLGKAASLIGSGIPSLSSLTSPLSWAMRASSNFAAAYGYSRPAQLEKTDRFWNTNQHYQNNADGPDGSFNLGLLQDNKVKLMSNAGGTDVDETSLAFLTQKPCAVSRITIGSAALGRRYTQALCPDSCFKYLDGKASPTTVPPYGWLSSSLSSIPPGINTDPGQVLTPSILFWLSTMFDKYRGGMKFTLKCNKTRFIGGRLLLMYTPHVNIDPFKRVLYAPEDTGLDPLGTDLFGHSKVWDLRESNMIEFECPFVSLCPYLRTDIPYGAFSLHVIDPINGPDDVISAIDVVIEVSGMSGFEFAEPRQKQYVVDSTTDFRNRGDFYAEPIVSQSGGVIDSNQPEYAELCIGEKVLTLKQLISRAEWTSVKTYKNVDGQENWPTPNPIPAKGSYLYPWYSNYFATSKRDIGGGLIVTAGSYKLSTTALITDAFAFCRGSTCYDVLGDGASCATYFPTLTGSELNGRLGSSSQIWEQGPYSKFKAPFYSHVSKIPTNPATYDIAATSVSGKTDLKASGWNKLFNQPVLYVENNVNMRIGVRAADDAQLAFFMRAPRIMFIGSGVFYNADNNARFLGSIDGNALPEDLI